MANEKMAQPFTTASPLLANFSYTDIADGTGIIAYYGAKGNNGFFLTTNSSIKSSLAWATSSGNPGTLINDDFDVTFNKAQVMRGTLIANLPIGNQAGSPKHMDGTVTVYHFDGSTETQLGTGTQESVVTAAVFPVEYRYLTISIPIARTHFKSGDTLRITVLVTKTGDASEAYAGHDPANRARTTDAAFTNSQMTFLVPFDLPDQ